MQPTCVFAFVCVYLLNVSAGLCLYHRKHLTLQIERAIYANWRPSMWKVSVTYVFFDGGVDGISFGYGHQLTIFIIYLLKLIIIFSLTEWFIFFYYSKAYVHWWFSRSLRLLHFLLMSIINIRKKLGFLDVYMAHILFYYFKLLNYYFFLSVIKIKVKN